MRRERRSDDACVRRELAVLRDRGCNFDPARRAEYTTANGWHNDELSRRLPGEAPGPPEPGGSWEVARRLMAGYEFADPSIVRAYYGPGEPLEGRTMLLEIRFRGLLRFDVGTRVAEVYDEQRTAGARQARVWGWAYRTLEGHFEKGQMDWQVWKWLDTGDVEFRIHAYSRRAEVANPLVRLGFLLLGRREQLAFLHSTMERMARLTETALHEPGRVAVWCQAERLTARGGFSTTPAHAALVERVPGAD